VRGAEGTPDVQPGRSSGSSWSEGSKNYFRNVEAVGSKPITSTDEGPGHGWFSNEERYDGFVEVVAAVWI
jgi:hypothetical protein